MTLSGPERVQHRPSADDRHAEVADVSIQAYPVTTTKSQVSGLRVVAEVCIAMDTLIEYKADVRILLATGISIAVELRFRFPKSNSNACST